MRIDWWTLGLQTLNLLVLVWLLSRYLFRPIAAILAARQAETNKLLADAQAAREQALSEQQHAAAETARIAATRSDAMNGAAREAEAARKAMLAAARQEADGLRSAWQAEREREEQQEAARLAERASLLATDIAAKVLSRLPQDLLVTPFLDGLASAIGKLPSATRDEIGAAGTAVCLTAVRPFTEAEDAACRAALAQVLGRSVHFEVQADAAVLAGLELRTPHALVRNSFRSDLDHIARELNADDRHAG